jgi:hypothetical protein
VYLTLFQSQCPLGAPWDQRRGLRLQLSPGRSLRPKCVETDQWEAIEAVDHANVYDEAPNHPVVGGRNRRTTLRSPSERLRSVFQYGLGLKNVIGCRNAACQRNDQNSWNRSYSAGRQVRPCLVRLPVGLSKVNGQGSFGWRPDVDLRIVPMRRSRLFIRIPRIRV